jgi:hypothetical protein
MRRCANSTPSPRCFGKFSRGHRRSCSRYCRFTGDGVNPARPCRAATSGVLPMFTPSSSCAVSRHWPAARCRRIRSCEPPPTCVEKAERIRAAVSGSHDRGFSCTRLAPFRRPLEQTHRAFAECDCRRGDAFLQTYMHFANSPHDTTPVGVVKYEWSHDGRYVASISAVKPMERRLGTGGFASARIAS